MVISLDEARVAARMGDWWDILEVGYDAGLQEVRRARRKLQLETHPDKGGDPELCQLVNLAADKLERMLDLERAERQREQDEEEERLAQEEERRRRRLEETERERRLHEEELRRQRQLRTKANILMVETVHQRTRNTITLGAHAAKAFPVIHRRNCRLHLRRKVRQSRILTYAVETEIAARRANREDKWPKTSGLETRCPDLAAELALLKKEYNKAYQSMRYLRDRNRPYTLALLTTRRLLRDAWMLYLALPAPMRDLGLFGTQCD